MSKKTKKIVKYSAISLACLLVVFGATTGILVLKTYSYEGKTLPTQYINNESVSGLTEEELVERLKEIAQNNLNSKVTFTYKDSSVTLSMEDLKASYNISEAGPHLRMYTSRPTLTQYINDLITTTTYNLSPTLNEDYIKSRLEEGLSNLDPAKNAYFTRDLEGNLVIVDHNDGQEIDTKKLALSLKQVRNGDTVTVHASNSSAKIVRADLETIYTPFTQLLNKDISLELQDNDSILVPINEKPELIRFVRIDDRIVLKIDPESANSFIEETVKSGFERTPEDVTITLNGDKAEFSSIGAPGVEINEDELLVAIGAALSEQLYSGNGTSIDTPYTRIEPEFKIAKELQNMGIKELISVGHTTYYGSPANRMHNIEVGLSRFNGVIIPANQNYSFNKTLGQVDGSTGYLPELVIKQEGTIPEFGGGLCQVSTTFYRGALLAGLEIIDRAPHSYAVSYYSQVDGHGLDATIYPPQRDLIVHNNTPGAILLQTFNIGPEAYYRFFGTHDQRKVEMDGPYISNYRSTNKTEYIVRDDFSEGQRRQVESPHTGFDALWYRTITDSEGNVTKETIESRYKATPAKYWVSPSDPAVSESIDTQPI